MIRIQTDNEQTRESLREMYYSIIDGRSVSRIGGMIPVGMWLSDAGDTYRLAVVFRRTLDGSMPDPGFPMSRPAIPR